MAWGVRGELVKVVSQKEKKGVVLKRAGWITG